MLLCFRTRFSVFLIVFCVFIILLWILRERRIDMGSLPLTKDVDYDTSSVPEVHNTCLNDCTWFRMILNRCYRIYHDLYAFWYLFVKLQLLLLETLMRLIEK